MFSRRGLVPIMAFLLLSEACGPVDPQAEEESSDAIGMTQQAVSCPASLKRYPVKGPHNNGYDATWKTWKCRPDATSVSNSDYIAGSHLGNDIFAARGTPLVAAMDGTIEIGFTDPTGGKVVYIKDSCGWWYYYAHLNSVSSALRVGSRVTAGTYLGELGNTGSASTTQPHLHFSIYPDGAYSRGINPYPLLSAVEATSCL